MAEAVDANPRHALAAEIKNYLDDWNFIAADSAIENFIDQEWLKENGGWELIPIIVEYLDEEHEETSPQLVNECSQLLQKLAEICKPKEILIALLEHCGENQSDIKFQNVLPAISVVFRRFCSEPKGKLAVYLDSTLDTLIIHINHIDLPKFPTLDNSTQWCTLENMTQIQDILNVVCAFANFLRPMVEMTLYEDGWISLQETDKCKQHQTWASMGVLAIPLTYLIMHSKVLKKTSSDDDTNITVKSNARQVTERIVKNICDMNSNILELVDFETVKRDFNKERFGSFPGGEIGHWKMAIGTLFFVVYDDACQTNPGQQMNFIDRLPFCYHPNHVFNTLLPSVTYLECEKDNYLAQYMAVRLGTMLAERMSPGSISKAELEKSIHTYFLANLIQIILYSPSEEVRKHGFILFKKYYGLFEANHARYRFVNIVLDGIHAGKKHSGLRGQIIVCIKDTALQQMTTKEGDIPDKQFSGHSLKALIRKICTLKHGIETDLLEISDEIISSLNLLICLMMKDKSKSACGIWDLKEELNTNYLKPLQKAINLSRVKLKNKPVEDPTDVLIKVMGIKLPHMNPNHTSDFLNGAFNTLSMIECVLCQLNSVIDGAD